VAPELDPARRRRFAQTREAAREGPNRDRIPKRIVLEAPTTVIGTVRQIILADDSLAVFAPGDQEVEHLRLDVYRNTGTVLTQADRPTLIPTVSITIVSPSYKRLSRLRAWLGSATGRPPAPWSTRL
jgi:hypothetical protein